MILQSLQLPPSMLLMMILPNLSAYSNHQWLQQCQWPFTHIAHCYQNWLHLCWWLVHTVAKWTPFSSACIPKRQSYNCANDHSYLWSWRRWSTPVSFLVSTFERYHQCSHPQISPTVEWILHWVCSIKQLLLQCYPDVCNLCHWHCWLCWYCPTPVHTAIINNHSNTNDPSPTLPTIARIVSIDSDD